MLGVFRTKKQECVKSGNEEQGPLSRLSCWRGVDERK